MTERYTKYQLTNDYQELFYRLAILVLLGWHDEARRFVESWMYQPVIVVKDE